MEQVWLNIGTVLVVFTLAIVSPGPNFILVVNRALTSSRQSGIYTAFGVATGSGLFALAGLLGLILIINSLPYFSSLVRLAGGGYLIYLGASMLWTCRRAPGGTIESSPGALLVKPRSAYLSGLATNLTNPKAWAFYFSLFTLVVDGYFPLWAKGFLTLAMFMISFGWYATMAMLVSDRRVQRHFLSFQPLFKSILGALLIMFGGRLLLKS